MNIKILAIKLLKNRSLYLVIFEFYFALDKISWKVQVIKLNNMVRLLLEYTFF